MLILSAFFLIIIVILYSQKRTRSRNLRYMSDKLRKILDEGTDEKVMVFNDDRELTLLISQINRCLEDRQKLRADYLKNEESSKKMLSNISHDIKTPLTVILGYLEILILNAGEDIKPILKKVEGRANQVMELINKFFTLSKIESGDMDLELKPIDLCEILRENVVDFYNILKSKDFQVEISIPEDKYLVMGNTEALNRVIFNLISNSIRYGHDGKYLKAEIVTDGSQISLSITDKGKGIDKSVADRVFDRLYTMEDSRNRKLGGNGLGLAIAKALVDKMHGTISLESIPDVKTTFTVTMEIYNPL